MRSHFKSRYLQGIILIVLMSIGFFSFVPVGGLQNVFNFAVLFLIFLGILLYRRERYHDVRLNFKYIVIGFMVFRFLSAIPAYLFHGQEMLYTLAVERTALFWLFYFLLHRIKVGPTVILKIVIFVGLAWAVLTIIQQLTYPFYLFASREDKETGGISYRAGVYRYMIRGLQYGVLSGFFYLIYFLNVRRLKIFLIYSLFFLGIFFHSARQFIASFMLSSVLLTLYLRGNVKKIAIFSFVLIGITFFLFFDALFAGYIRQSQEDLNDENIRLLAFNFFSYEYFPHWLCNILGNGKPYTGSAYGKEYFDYIIGSLSLYREDVGIFGTYNQYGLLYALVVILGFIKVLLIKVRQQHLFVKLFAVYALTLLPLSEYSYNSGIIPFFCLFFYLIDHYDLSQKKVSNRHARI